MARIARVTVVAGLCCMAAMGIVWYLAVKVSSAGGADFRTLLDFNLLGAGKVGSLAVHLVDTADPKPFVIAAAILVGAALVQRKFLIAAIVLVILVGANWTTEFLKQFLEAKRLGDPLWNIASWPSGHSTAAMSLGIGLIFVTPTRLRPIAGALAALYAVSIGFSLLVRSDHLPSDVLGGFLQAGIWGFAGLFVLRLAQRGLKGQWEPDRMSWLTAILPGILVACILFAVVVGRTALHPPVVTSAIGFMIGGGMIALLGCCVTTGLVLAFRVRSQEKREFFGAADESGDNINLSKTLGV
jgi:membrane-associated phospholipid phosphatase